MALTEPSFSRTQTDSVREKALRFLRYVGAGLLILVSGGGLIGGSLGHKGVSDISLGRVERLALGLELPWIVAWLVGAQQTQMGQDKSLELSLRGGYWSRLALSYLWAVIAAVLAFFIVPFVLMVLLDSGLI